MAETETRERPKNFITEIIDRDLETGEHDSVYTRFPPEPNGYLHIGHAKSICLNFGIARDYNGKCNLRFDDTNPAKEDVEYVESIKEDVQWLGFDWADLRFASDYFEQLYNYAVDLIKQGKAYVDDQSADEIRQNRGTPTEPGTNSPHRERSVEENLDLFVRMRKGEFPDGTRVLRAKIDMAHPNLVMRDPTLYRIRHATHHRTGDRWCIYPMYDFTHCLSDAIEHITHSLCTLEFENNRELYDWVLDNLEAPARPHQYEFARLEVSYTIMSKRKLLQLVEERIVSGWDDPRMPTISGMRRRGFTPGSIRDFSDRIGVAKKRDTRVELHVLEDAVRADLNKTAPRLMAVLDPLKIVITNYPEDQEDSFDIVNNPEDESQGTRSVPFSREIYIERGDFMEDPPKKFFRLAPGREVRLREACLITCKDVIKDDAGRVTELHCEWDPDSHGGDAPDGRKVRGTLHWVSARHALDVEVRLYDNLFMTENPDDAPEGEDFRANLNPNSLEILPHAKVEPAVASAKPGERFQFLRSGYFCVDPDSKPDALIFNRTVTLKDTWAKMRKG